MQHKAVGLGDTHKIYNYEFETIAERDAFIPSLEDLKSICLVDSPFSYYTLKSIEPVEWEPLGTITINLEVFSIYSQEEILELLSGKQNTYDITSSEYKCGYSRGGKEVFGIEVDFGALPNNTTKSVAIPNYNANYNYWIDTSKSYSQNSTETIPLPRAPSGLSNNSYWIDIIILSPNIRIITASNYSSYTKTKVVLNYTKE